MSFYYVLSCPFRGICYGLVSPQNLYVEALTPSASECGLLWKESYYNSTKGHSYTNVQMCTHVQQTKVIRVGPKPL